MPPVSSLLLLPNVGNIGIITTKERQQQQQQRRAGIWNFLISLELKIFVFFCYSAAAPV